MPVEVAPTNLDIAMNEIERDQEENAIPIDQRGGEVLDQVNDVFNLMAMRIKTQVEQRKKLAKEFG